MAVSRADSSDFDAKVAGEDLSAKLFYLAKIDTDGTLVLAGDGGEVYGVITEVAEEGKSASVQVSGIAKVVAGAGITAGVKVMSSSTGKAITATGAGKATFGIARSTVANADELVEVLIDRSRVPA